MRYLNVGDFVKLWENCYGIILASSEDERYLKNYDYSVVFSNVDQGYLILTNEIGLCHIPIGDEIEFIFNRYNELVKLNSDEMNEYQQCLHRYINILNSKWQAPSSLDS